MSGSSFAPFFSRWRQVSLGGRVVVEGCVDSAHASPSRELASAIAGWPGYHYWQRRGADRWLLLVEETERPREQWWLHLLLLLLTVATTAWAAAGWSGRTGELSSMPAFVETMRRGLPFALPLLAIVAAHELGHYVLARRYRIDASAPYFLPMLPPSLNVIGTFGAVVRLRSPIFDRRTLFDVSVAGPLIGLLVSLPVLAFGLAHSSAAIGSQLVPLAHQFVVVGGRTIFLGDTAIGEGMRRAFFGGQVVRLHPAAVAGWIGVFMTMLNLLPLTQFDGGHIAFALFGRPQRWLAWGTLAALGAMGVLLWPGWWAWAALAFVAGRGRLAHPRLVSAEAPLDRGRIWIGALAVVALALCFSPIPVQLR